MKFLTDLLVKISEAVQKLISLFLVFIFCVWELIIVGSIITLLCGFIFYKIGVFDNFGETYASEYISPPIEVMKIYFYIDFEQNKTE